MALKVLERRDYPGGMTARKSIPPARKRPKSSVAPAAPKIRLNRIYELSRKSNLSYGEIAAELGCSETQIARLASGERKLSQEWMNKLAPVLGVTPSEVMERSASEGLRAVRVTGRVAAGFTAEPYEYPADEQMSVMVPDDAEYRSLALYAREVDGESMNLVYPHRSVAVMSSMLQRPGEIVAGKRYHVRITRRDGATEETIKTLYRDTAGRYWLKPESDSPEFTATPLEPREGEEVILLGRVRWAVTRE